MKNNSLKRKWNVYSVFGVYDHILQINVLIPIYREWFLFFLFHFDKKMYITASGTTQRKWEEEEEKKMKKQKKAKLQSNFAYEYIQAQLYEER